MFNDDRWQIKPAFSVGPVKHPLGIGVWYRWADNDVRCLRALFKDEAEAQQWIDTVGKEQVK